MAKQRKNKEKADPIPDEVLDRLYGGPPEEFVANRTAAARDLTKAGDGPGAAAVRALKRPNAPAAAINRAVRATSDQARALLDAGRDLRGAHEALLGGGGDRDALKAATAAERQAVNSLMKSAVGGKGRVSADVERRIRDTLEAVALDPGVREQFAAGRLEKDARAAGLAMDVSTGGGRARPSKRRGDDQAKRKSSQRELRKLQDAVRSAKETLEGRRRDVTAAERARERADAALRDARKHVKEAEGDLRRARQAAERHGGSSR